MANGDIKTASDRVSDQHQDELALRAGALNLINGCIDDVTGKSVLLVCEDPELGWYDSKSPTMVATCLREMGAKVSILPVGMPQNGPIAEIQTAMDSMDEVIFFSRIGDQGRFDPHYVSPHSTMCYARTASMLGGAYGHLDHHAMIMMKNAVNDITLDAAHIKITCPQGTFIEGSPEISKTEGNEVVVSRFPMGMPQPVLAGGFKGEVVLSHYLTSTGSKVYEPGFLELDTKVTAKMEGNRITGFSGSDESVTMIRDHYNHVAKMFGLDAFNVDSWHAGIHPQMYYDEHMSNDPVRWSNTVFTNPRFLHFHTCGKIPPGEICWMVVDATVTIDGVALWENGRLYPERFVETKAVLDFAPELAKSYANPCKQVGLNM